MSQAITLALHSVRERPSIASMDIAIGGIELDKALFEFWDSPSLVLAKLGTEKGCAIKKH